MKVYFFIAISFIIGILIILHHYLKHVNDDTNILNKFIQIDDINNHETWALFLFGIGIGMIIYKYITL